MRTSLLILMATALPAFTSCGSNKASDDATAVPCICGTDEAALDGCAHAYCRDGKQNPDNPDCVCGPMEYGEE